MSRRNRVSRAWLARGLVGGWIATVGFVALLLVEGWGRVESTAGVVIFIAVVPPYVVCLITYVTDIWRNSGLSTDAAFGWFLAISYLPAAATFYWVRYAPPQGAEPQPARTEPRISRSAKNRALNAWIAVVLVFMLAWLVIFGGAVLYRLGS
jgi:hypothetical protein